MNTSSFNYLFGIDGNFTVKMEEMNRATGEFTAQVQKSQNTFERIIGLAGKVDILSDGIVKTTQALASFGQSGIALNTSMTDLQAVTGVTGEGLRQIEGYARDTAKAFGIDAAGAVESYKLILGQLSPELAKSPVALKAMGEHVATLSKLMGGDATAAAETLNTAMNQYGVDLSDPIKASEAMGRMMNVMAAAGQEGSAELPQIKEALEQAGMAAKGAGVSFEEANAAIQVLDKAGKKGSEGGIALRNVIATLSQGRFLPKDVQKELRAAGINVTDLADRGKSLKERLELLRPVMTDAALFAKLFGKENTNAAMALVGGTEEVGRYTEAIQGTQSANDQAAVVMEGFAERQARIRQQIEDFKISVFNATGDVYLWAGALSDTLIPLSQLMPLLSGAYPIIKGVSIWIFQGAKGLFLFGKGALTALINVGKLAVTLLTKGLSALAYYIGSLVTGGSAQLGFAAMSQIAFSSFKAAAVTACRTVSAAIMSIPLIGWIAAAIAAIVALGVYFWNTSAKFRATLKGLWAAFKATFSNIWEMAKTVFSGIGDLIKAAFSLDGDGISAAISKMTGAFAKFGKETGNAFKEAYDQEMKESAEAEKSKGKGEGSNAGTQGGIGGNVDLPIISTPGGGGGSSTDSSSRHSGGGGSSKATNVTIHIGKLVDNLTIKSTNLSTDPSEVKGIITELLISAVNDANLAIQ
jgi:phage tail tape measure protein, TP901 family|uniref:Minor tail protein n=1 Tax=Myoviridae sp. ctO4916 TaxID=2826645 RepID=A0A8S5N495_9CAUD|nr:MAG TPA: minor tail protein [Myoviridae sp. ctO4916]